MIKNYISNYDYNQIVSWIKSPFRYLLFIAFDLVFGVIKEYDKDIQEKFIWPKKKIQLRKLSGFIEMEQRKILTIMRGLWKE